MKQLLLFPYNGNAREAASIIEAINSCQPEWNLLGFLDDNQDLIDTTFGSYKVLGSRQVMRDYPDAYILAVPGRPDNFHNRHEIIESLSIPKERFATVVHPSAFIGKPSKIGANCLIMPNVVLTANVTLGNNVVILPNSVISHDTRIQDFTLVGSNVSISGNVTIGKGCYIGTGSKIIQEVRIGNLALVGLGSVVITDVKSRTVVAGNPARQIREIG